MYYIIDVPDGIDATTVHVKSNDDKYHIVRHIKVVEIKGGEPTIYTEDSEVYPFYIDQPITEGTNNKLPQKFKLWATERK